MGEVIPIRPLRCFELDDRFGYNEWAKAESAEQAVRLVLERFAKNGMQMEPDDWRVGELTEDIASESELGRVVWAAFVAHEGAGLLEVEEP